MKLWTCEPENIFKGLSLFLSDYHHDYFHSNSLRLKKIVDIDEPKGMKLVTLDVDLKISKEPFTISFMSVFPDEKGVYKCFGSEYFSPLVLVERFERINDGDKNGSENNDKRMKLDDFWVIPGYFLFKALTLYRNIIKSKELSADKLQNMMSSFKIGNQYMILYKKSDSKRRVINIPIFYPLENNNTLLRESNLRKVVYHGSKVPEDMRLQHCSHLGALDLLETPESISMGLVFFMASKAMYNPKKLEIVKTSMDNPQAFLSLSTRSVPFMHHSDSVRVMMGGKNLKQALKTVGSEVPLVKTGVEDDIKVDFGVNAFVGYLLFNGLNFEDGIVISKSFAEKMKVERIEKFKIRDFVFLPVRYELKIDERKQKIVMETPKNFSGSMRFYIEYQILKKKGEKVFYKDDLLKRTIRIFSEDSKQIFSEKQVFKYEIPYTGIFENDLKDEFFKIVYQAHQPSFKKSEEKFDKSKKLDALSEIEFIFKFHVIRPLEVGDKLTGRHGNKGTVSRILPDDEMPYIIENGKRKHLEVILSPFSIVTRMNLGQLIETQGSMVGITTGKAFEKVDFSKLRNYEKYDVFFKDGLKTKAVVGYQYIVRLDHCVRDKLHIVARAKTSKITGQPFKGKTNDGGQRIGEMEFWTLFDYNVPHIIGLFSRTNLRTWKEYDDYILSFKEIFSQKVFDYSRKTPESKKQLLFKKIGFSCDVKKKELKTFIETISDEKKRLSRWYRINIELLSKNSYLRRCMLGRRIHYSGRGVIVPATDIDIDHVYLPVDFAIEFGILKINSKDLLEEVRDGNMEKRKELASAATEKAIDDKLMVLLNRQPSLHQHNIQAFYPVFWENFAIGLPIMLCEGFAADFDGDTMAVYYPITQSENPEIKVEMEKMLPSRNLFKVGNGELLLSIGQDLAYGNYILTGRSKKEIKKELIGLMNNVSVKDVAKKLLDWQSKVLEAATKNNLSVSFFEAANCSGDMEKIKISGARGKDENFTQMSKKIEINGKEFDQNFGNGLDMSLYLGIGKTEDDFENTLAVRGRKSMLDKKLHVAGAGYFTRKLVEFLYPLRIKEHDCGTKHGIEYSRNYLKKLESEGITLERLILGRYVKTSKNENWELVTYENIEYFRNKDKIMVRSPITCNLKDGVCSKCCGVKLSNFGEFKIGDFIGVLSGHSIGEFGTQYSMKTFHSGKAGFKMPSEEFFKNKANYKDYLIELADKKLLKNIEVSSIYLEILFYYLNFIKVKSESEVKKYLKKIEDYGIFSSISFEMGAKELTKKIKSLGDIVTIEKSPKAIYALCKKFEVMI